VSPSYPSVRARLACNNYYPEPLRPDAMSTNHIGTTNTSHATTSTSPRGQSKRQENRNRTAPVHDRISVQSGRASQDTPRFEPFKKESQRLLPRSDTRSSSTPTPEDQALEALPTPVSDETRKFVKIANTGHARRPRPGPIRGRGCRELERATTIIGKTSTKISTLI
jgi:hypothetical protein